MSKLKFLLKDKTLLRLVIFFLIFGGGAIFLNFKKERLSFKNEKLIKVVKKNKQSIRKYESKYSDIMRNLKQVETLLTSAQINEKKEELVVKIKNIVGTCLVSLEEMSLLNEDGVLEITFRLKMEDEKFDKLMNKIFLLEKSDKFLSFKRIEIFQQENKKEIDSLVSRMYMKG